jgi:hypothetical protein
MDTPPATRKHVEEVPEPYRYGRRPFLATVMRRLPLLDTRLPFASTVILHAV